MVSTRPSRGPIQLPKAPENVPLDPKFYNNGVRAIEQQFQTLYQLNNNTLILDPEPTYRTSIAGNTVDSIKLRDFLLTTVIFLKANNKIN